MRAKDFCGCELSDKLKDTIETARDLIDEDDWCTARQELQDALKEYNDGEIKYQEENPRH